MGTDKGKTEEEPKTSKTSKPKTSTAVKLVGKGTNLVVTVIGFYSVYVANVFRSILYPKFPDIDPNTHEFVTKHGNIFRPGDDLRVRLWAGTTAWPVSKPPIADFECVYDWDNFTAMSKKINVSISQAQLKKGTHMLLSAEVLHLKTGNKVRAKGDLVKQMKKPELRPKYRLLRNDLCPEPEEPLFGKQTQIGRGIPQMQVRLVYDLTAYPATYFRGPYTPRAFVDEFWLTNDQLVTLNTTGNNTFESEVSIALMSSARWRFQAHMEASFEQNAKMLGEDSEELLQMRDLFANTHPYLLAMTLVVSVLHMVFEFLAFKNDVEFWQGCDPAALNKFVSVQSIAVGIVMQVLLLMYLWDESANLLVLVSSIVSILIDVWKVQRAMQVKLVWLFRVIPLPTLVSKLQKEKVDDFDAIAMKYLAMGFLPPIFGYAVYTLVFDCHRSWYSYFLSFSATCVYSLGFILMTPQVFINYKHKTVAYLPWRKFVYRAICTFIDDLFAMIIRMPTMHRLSCFRDDIVFFIYLYQRHLYPVDKDRMFDEDGYELSPDEVTAQSSGGDAPAEPKKVK